MPSRFAENPETGAGHPRDTAGIKGNRLDEVVALRRFRGAWAQLCAGAVGVVSLRRRRLRAEREAERVFAMSPALLAVVGLDGYLRRFNPAFEVFGYPREELLSQPWIEFVHPDDRERMAQAAASLEHGAEFVGLENRVVCRDGSFRRVEWSTRVVPEEGLFYVAGRDVTESRRAAEEQAALRRVATLVARQTPPDEVFAAVAREVGEIVGVDATHMGRYDAHGTVVNVAQWARYPGPGVPIGARFPLEGDSVSARVLKTGRPARMDSYAHAPGVIGETVRGMPIRVSIGVPISVEGQPWGVMVASSRATKRFPPETESRLRSFTELVATAIANTQARSEVARLAEEQGRLRRVATLVARGVPEAEVFEAVAREAGQLLGVDAMHMGRYEEGAAVSVAGWSHAGDHLPVGTRVELDGTNVASRVWQSRQPARIDGYSAATGAPADRLRNRLGVSSSVAVPIDVDERLWGLMIASSRQHEPLPADTESRLLAFTELVATAIANADARAEVARLADEQAALRRVATLVAQGAPPSAVFDAVTGEVARLLDASAATLGRYDDDVLTVVAQHGDDYVGPGDRFPLGGINMASIVRRTERAARLDDVTQASGAIGDHARRAAVRSAVAAPVVVDGRTWGLLTAVWMDPRPPPDDTEQRIAGFAELLDTAIANADTRDQLTASRARVLAAGDEARRRVVRDLHDGAQQRLVHTTVTLKLAQRALEEDPASAKALMAEALRNTERATAELRELAHGILPSVLTLGGLRFGVDAFVSRLVLPVLVDIPSERLPPDIEASAYFIVAEALTNVVKHARATRAEVRARVDDDVLAIEVRDDGVGGADPRGHGLVGIADRIDALGGRLRIESGRGTMLIAELPLPSHEAARAGGPPNAIPSHVDPE